MLNIVLSLSEGILIIYLYYKKIFRNSDVTMKIKQTHSKIENLKEIYSLIFEVEIKRIDQVKNLINKSRIIIRQLNLFSDKRMDFNLLKIKNFNQYLLNNLKYLEEGIIDQKVIEEKINSKYKKQIQSVFKKIEKKYRNKFHKIIDIFRLIFSLLIILGFITFSLFYITGILFSYDLYLIGLYVYFIIISIINNKWKILVNNFES